MTIHLKHMLPYAL